MKSGIRFPSILLLFLMCSGPALAQDARDDFQELTGGLWDFVSNSSNGASPLQKAVGRAIEPMCLSMVGLSADNELGTQADNLLLRCGELVSTAQSLNQVPNFGRDLNISGGELRAALQQVAGEEMLANGTMSARVTSGQYANIAGRLNALRLGNAGLAIGGRMANADPSGQDDADLGSTRLAVDRNSMSGGGAAADIGGSRWGWFLEGSYNNGDRDQTAAEDKFDFDTSSFTFGVDYLFDGAVVGFSVGSDTYKADFANASLVSGGNIEVDGTSGSFFGAVHKGKVFFNGIASFGNLNTDSVRIVRYDSNGTCTPACPDQNARLVGDTDGDYLSIGVQVGADLSKAKWDISPSFSLTSRDVNIDGYTETDATNPSVGELELAYSTQNIDSFRAILAVAFTGTFSKDFGVLSPYFRAELHHEFEDDPVMLTAKYAAEETLAGLGSVDVGGLTLTPAGPGVFSSDITQCISCFQMNSDKIDTDFAVVAVGLSAVFARRLQIYGVYEALLGVDNVSSDSISVGLRRQF